MSFDNQITLSSEQLRNLALLDAAQAKKNFELLAAALGPEDFSELFPAISSSLSRSADPDMALNNLERFLSVITQVPRFVSLCRAKPDILRQLITISGASRFLSTFLIAHADDSLTWFSEFDFLTKSADKAALARRLAFMTVDAADDKVLSRILRVFRKQEMFGIGLRDLLGATALPEVVEELSDLAEVCLQKAYERADAGLRNLYGRPLVQQPGGTTAQAGFAVIAMGKLGGRELNFSSDVDLMFVYTVDGETEGVVRPDGAVMNRITNHQYFIKLAEKLSSLIGEKTEDGFVFRVDLRLRPEGQRGPLAQSLGGYEIYYESWGQTWERSALIKARPVAGDEETGREFLERITPFVFRRYLDYGAIAEIGDMKQKINRDVELKGRTHRDVKLGYGGIREIEFVIQALQLIYGGRDRSLREKTALKALHMLSQKGLITYQEQATLAKAYIFLRTVEHRIQVLDDLQTQTMPSDERDLRALARRAGYLEPDREAEMLLRDYAEHTRQVREIYDELFAFTGEAPAGNADGGDYGRLLEPDTTEQEAVALLGTFGFRDPGKAYRNLALLRDGPAFVHQTPRSRKLFSEIFPPLLREIVFSPDPDMALNHLESFLASQGSWEAFQSLVKIDPKAVKVLIAVFANSEYLSRLLVSRPVFLQNMIESRKSFGTGTAARLANELGGTLSRAADLAEKLDALRLFKHQEEIRIGMADLLSGADQMAVSRELSKLAEACLASALGMAAAEIGKRCGIEGFTAGLAIIGVGKLGGRELVYGSDLDILFVYFETHADAPPAGMSVFEYFSKVAEKTISYLSTLTREGFVFRVDTRLRPTGSKGPLAQSIDAFRNYYASQAETWELQALLRARFVAGDRLVGTEFCEVIQGLIYREVDRTALAADIRAMRKRMEDETGKESSASYNIKQGAGGLVDIEFLVQYLQLVHGRQYCSMRVPGTFNALRASRKLKLIAVEDYLLLKHAYLFLRKLESRMRVVSNQSTSLLARDPGKIDQLARRMGYAYEGAPAGQKLLADYELLSSRVRAIFTSWLGAS